MDVMAASATPRTVHHVLTATAARTPHRPALHVVAETAAAYGIAAGETTYADLAERVEARRARYLDAGYGSCHRVGLLLENRPDFLVHFLALNALGASIVPINPDLRAGELEYLVDHSEVALAVAIPSRHAELEAAAEAVGRTMPVVEPDASPPPAPAASAGGWVDAEAAILYTSGTTGAPKGCVLTNAYFLRCAEWYHGMGGLCALRRARSGC